MSIPRTVLGNRFNVFMKSSLSSDEDLKFVVFDNVKYRTAARFNSLDDATIFCEAKNDLEIQKHYEEKQPKNQL